MSNLTTSGVVREILLKDPEIDTTEAIRRAKLKGLQVPAEKIRHSIHNQRNTIRAEVAAKPKVAPAAARETSPVITESTADLGGVLSNVSLVNKIVGLCGGVENARQAAEVVHACGGLESFLKHLEVVADIRDSKLPN